MAARCLSPPHAAVYHKDAERAHFALEKKKRIQKKKICVGRARQWNARSRSSVLQLVSGANWSARLMGDHNM